MDKQDIDLYSVLNATRRDTDDQLRKNYFLLARVFHPDKLRREESNVLDPNNDAFIQIEEAYKILTNKAARIVYDHYGHHGLAIYFQLEHRFKEYERILNTTSSKEARDSAIHEMCALLEDNMSSSFMAANEAVQQEVHTLKCKANLQDLSNHYYGYWATKDRAKRLEIFQLPKFQKFASDHKYNINLPERRGIIGVKISNQCNFANGVGIPGVELSFDKDLAETWHWTTKMLIRRGNECVVSQVAKSLWHNKMAVYGGFSLGINGLDPTIGLMANPYPSTTVIFDSNPLKGANSSLIAYGTGKWEFSLNAGFAKNLFRLQPGILYKLDPDTSVNAFLGVSKQKIMLATGLTYALSPGSRISMHLKGGFRFSKQGGYNWLAGIKFGLTYHGLNLSLPIMLGSHNVTSNGYSLLFTAVAMLAGALGFTYYVCRERKAKKKQEAVVHDKYNTFVEQYSNYKSMVQGLEKYSSDKLFLEELNNGLIIIEAFYGGVNVINRLAEDPGYRPVEPLRGNKEEYLTCQAINVTTLLQIMVTNGKLVINRTFNNYPGLVNPSVTDSSKKALYVKVKHRGLEKTVVICPEDRDSFIIPRDIF